MSPLLGPKFLGCCYGIGVFKVIAMCFFVLFWVLVKPFRDVTSVVSGHCYFSKCLLLVARVFRGG